MPVKSKLLMLVLSSPSGAGKTTLSKKIQESDPSFKVSISHTTRKARPNEVDGVDYHFVNKKQFEDLLSKKEFYEYAQIFDNFYGTSKTSVNNLTKKGYNVLFDIDWQGAKQLTKFKELTSCPVILNTSMNIRGEPIVCTPLDAYKCFLSANLDVLVVGNFLLIRKDQFEFSKSGVPGLS